jgi:hypothetical protein
MPGSTNLLPNYSMLFRYQDVGAYNPVQLSRFWSFVRGTDRVNIKYNAANFKHPRPALLDLLQIGFVATPAGRPVEEGSDALATDGRWVLWGRADPLSRAEAIMSWRMVDGKPEALEAVAAPGFDPSRTLILEPASGVPPPPGALRPDPTSVPAIYRADGTQHGVIEVEVPRRAIVLVRTPFERNWHALVDGRPAPVLPADYLVQGVPVGPGRHVIDLSYDDPWIGYGLLGSGLSVAALLTAALMALRIQRRPGAVEGEGGVASDTAEGTDTDRAASAIEPRR